MCPASPGTRSAAPRSCPRSRPRSSHRPRQLVNLRHQTSRRRAHLAQRKRTRSKSSAGPCASRAFESKANLGRRVQRSNRCASAVSDRPTAPRSSASSPSDRARRILRVLFGGSGASQSQGIIGVFGSRRFLRFWWRLSKILSPARGHPPRTPFCATRRANRESFHAQPPGGQVEQQGIAHARGNRAQRAQASGSASS